MWTICNFRILQIYVIVLLKEYVGIRLPCFRGNCAHAQTVDTRPSFPLPLPLRRPGDEATLHYTIQWVYYITEVLWESIHSPRSTLQGIHEEDVNPKPNPKQ